MASIDIDFAALAELTESTSLALRDRLDARDVAYETVEAEGAGGAIVPVRVIRNQLDASMPADGYHDLLNNCGPATVSMIVKRYTGRDVYPDAIADLMMSIRTGGARTEDTEGYTAAWEQAEALRRLGVPATSRRVYTDAAFRELIRDQIRNHRLTECLGFANIAIRTGGHFWLNNACDEPTYQFGMANPWRGAYQTRSWDDAEADVVGNGGYVVTCDAPAPALPEATSDAEYRSIEARWTAKLRYDTNLRTGPYTSKGLLLTIPAGTTIWTQRLTDEGTAVVGANPRRRWYRITYRRRTGWLSLVGIDTRTFKRRTD